MDHDNNSIIRETANLLDRLGNDKDVSITWQSDLKETAVMLRDTLEPEVVAAKLTKLSENKELPYFTRVGLWRVVSILEELENSQKTRDTLI
ncbi:MAG: UPF0147 family protein [Candidatus Kariarchaeaceae archaeon]|jgi:uncharacterized protein (UPF0147 family)